MGIPVPAETGLPAMGVGANDVRGVGAGSYGSMVANIHRRGNPLAQPSFVHHGQRRAGRVIVAAAALLLLAACTSGTDDVADADPSGTPGDSWTVTTPPGIEPSALTTAGDTVLVGGASPNQQPGLAVLRGGTWQSLPVTPATGYGAKAALLYVAADGDGRLVAIGTATGGAHLNPRWTAWIGALDAGIVEEPQTVETFGGPDAGGITGVAGGADPLVIGTWTLPAGGLGVASWRHAGTIWEREPVAAALTGTGSATQTTATAVATTASSTVVVGLETSLAAGSIHQQGIAWIRPRDGTGWKRIDLPASEPDSAATDSAATDSAATDSAATDSAAIDSAAIDSAAIDSAATDSAATDVACTADACVIVGRSGDRLAAWRLGGGSVSPLTGVPARAVDRYAGQPRVAVGGSPVATAVAVTAADGSSAVLLSPPEVPTTDGDPAAWRAIDPPPGEIRRVTLTGDTVHLLLRGSDERQAVYSRPT